LTEAAQKLARRLGLFDATMLVMNGIIGAGIFINPKDWIGSLADLIW
jgi:amino acid transporter